MDTRIFHKTRVCVYYKSDRGCVHGDNCLYAHGEEDLKIAPDLRIADWLPGDCVFAFVCALMKTRPCPCTPEESVNALTQLVGALHQQHTQLQALVAAQEAQILMHQQQQALEAYLQASPLNPAAAAAALLGIHSYSQYEQASYPPLNPMMTPFPMPGFGDYVPAPPVPMAAMLPRSEDVQIPPLSHFHSNGIRQKVVDSFTVRDSAERRKLFLERYGRQHRENNDSVERRVRLMEFIGVEYADRSIAG
ncbi:hypothetical protein FOZ62_027558 [Perkinsus olseni]|uniref:C3H1-type domain-containing protein n=1 Tax=Perkinsus olseni TaxID=32597 RepID=A0A7J6NSM6_PEROL|nr:hypothetical protein FOZ62_027558 [Perkinsus olseni]